MPLLAYSVVAVIPEETLATEYIRWLTGGHVQDVIRGGARSASVARALEPPGSIRIESRYEFEDRSSYDHYVRDVAPTLRAQGLGMFGDRGVRFERQLTEIVYDSTRTSPAREP